MVGKQSAGMIRRALGAQRPGKARIIAWKCAFFALLAAALLFVSHGAYFSYEHAKDARYVEALFSVEPDESAERALMRALAVSFDLPPHLGAGNRPNYGISHPLLRALGPPARLVHIHGGHCGRRARLLINILTANGVPAHKVHLSNERYAEFSHSHHYVHAVVEAWIDGHWVVVDPLYNLAFTTPAGDLAGLDEIRGDRSLFESGVSRADTRYTRYYEELYTYDEYRKFIWNSLPGGEALFAVLENLFGPERARDIRTPLILEQPLRAVAWGSYATGSFSMLAALFVWRRRVGPGYSGR